MPKKTALPNKKQLVDENAGLRIRLEESEDTLRAIRSGEVDAIVVSGVGGEQVFTLTSAERPYRALIEDMKEGAMTLTSEGVILYANRCFAEMLKTPLEKVISSTIHTWIAPDELEKFLALLREDKAENRHEELVLISGDGTPVPVYLSVNPLTVEGMPDCFGLVVIDLTEQKKSNEAILAAEKRAYEMLEERQRLAHNLHDAVNQSLFAASMIAEILPRMWERDQIEAKRSLHELRTLTKGALAEMRALLAELQPSMLADSDLGDLLRQLGDALQGRTNILVAVIITGKFIYPSEIQVLFYRVCQEALNNIALHAKCSQVEIRLQQVGNVLELCIRDNGQGFDPEQAFSEHSGLRMLRERADASGAGLTVASRPGYGTEVILNWPAPPLITHASVETASEQPTTWPYLDPNITPTHTPDESLQTPSLDPTS
jgi:PAS domain S-box-containing protein